MSVGTAFGNIALAFLELVPVYLVFWKSQTLIQLENVKEC